MSKLGDCKSWLTISFSLEGTEEAVIKTQSSAPNPPRRADCCKVTPFTLHRLENTLCCSVEGLFVWDCKHQSVKCSVLEVLKSHTIRALTDFQDLYSISEPEPSAAEYHGEWCWDLLQKMSLCECYDLVAAFTIFPMFNKCFLNFFNVGRYALTYVAVTLVVSNSIIWSIPRLAKFKLWFVRGCI